MTSRLTLVALGLLAATPAFPQESGAALPRTRPVQLAPWAGFDFGGVVWHAGNERSFRPAPAYGVALSVPISESWRIEALYSRQPTRIAGGARPPVDIVLERYLAGVQEELGESERTRWFGSAWLGVTRFVPGLAGFGSEARFGAGLGLGMKRLFTDDLGLRLEARGFFTDAGSDLGLACSETTCLFDVSGWGLWQGDVSAGLIVAF